MNGKFVKDITINDDEVVKKYSLLNKNSLEKYINALKDSGLKLANIKEIKVINKETFIFQDYIKSKNISEFLVEEAIKSKKLSKLAFKLFKSFIEYYFKYIFTLKDYSVDCKLSNFLVEDFTLVDIVPILKNSEFDKNVNNIKYVCFNKDCQIKNIITYWLKSFICFSYEKNIAPEKALKKDFNKMVNFVKRFYEFKKVEELNEIEKGYNYRFNLLNENIGDFLFFKKTFMNNGFYKTLNKNLQSNVGKIYILGGSGIGKTYVCNLLKENLNIKTFNLDDIYWKKDSISFGEKEENEIRDANLKNILNKNKNYIIEGSYLDEWTLPIFDNADKIYIVKCDYDFQKKRIIKRFLKRRFGIEVGPKKETIKSIKGLLKWSKDYNIKLEKFIVNNCEKYENKIIYLNSTRNILIDLMSL